MLTAPVATFVEPENAPVLESLFTQLIELIFHPARLVSVTLYVVKVVIPEKVFVAFAGVTPSSTSEKPVSGAGLAVKLKDCELSGVACLFIVTVAGKMIADAWI